MPELWPDPTTILGKPAASTPGKATATPAAGSSLWPDPVSILGSKTQPSAPVQPRGQSPYTPPPVFNALPPTGAPAGNYNSTPNSILVNKANPNDMQFPVGTGVTPTTDQYKAIGIDTKTQIPTDAGKQAAILKVPLDKAQSEITYRKGLIQGDMSPKVAGFLTTFENSTIAGKLNGLSNPAQTDVKGMIADEYAKSHPALSVVAKGMGTLVDTVMLSNAGAGFNLAEKTTAAAGGIGDLYPTATRVVGKGLESGTVFGVQSFLNEGLTQVQQEKFKPGKLAAETGKGFAFGAATGGAGGTSSLIKQVGYAGAGVAGLTTIETLVQNKKITGQDLVNIGVNSAVAMLFQAVTGAGSSEKFKTEDYQKLSYNNEVNRVMTSGASRAEAETTINTLRALQYAKVYSEATGKSLPKAEFEKIVKNGIETLVEVKPTTQMKQIVDEVPASFKGLPAQEKVRIIEKVTEDIKAGDSTIAAIQKETAHLPGAKAPGFVAPVGNLVEQMAAAPGGFNPQATPAPQQQGNLVEQFTQGQGQTLYHGTNDISAEKIKQNGFKSASKTFFTDDEGAALHFAEEKSKSFGGKPVVVAVDASQANPTFNNEKGAYTIDGQNIGKLKIIDNKSSGFQPDTRPVVEQFKSELPQVESPQANLSKVEFPQGQITLSQVTKALTKAGYTKQQISDAIIEITSNVKPVERIGVKTYTSAGVLDTLQQMEKKQNQTTPTAPVVESKPSPVTLQATPIPGLAEFIEQDVAPAAKSATQGFIETLKLVRDIVAPRSAADPRAVDSIMRMLGERNKYDYVLDKSTKHIDKIFDSMKQEDQIAFVDRMKRGEKQPTHELQAIADMMRKIDQANWEEASKFGPDLAWKENHFRVLWKKIPGAIEKTGFLGLFKKPLQGTKGFFKQSTLESMSEGIEKGGVPYSYNPMVTFKLAQADIMKYITAQKWMKDARARGSMQFVSPGKPMPEGKALINDRISHVYLGGGRWVADANEARLINNYLSPDYIRETALGKGLVYLKNLTTSIELALSPFHFIFETVETAGSSLGLGLQKIFNQGDLLGGAKDIVTSPISPYTTAKLGGAVKRYIARGDVINDKWVQKLIKEYPEAKQIIDDLFTGGAKLEMHEEYRNTTAQTFKDNVGKGNYIGASLRALPAFNEQLMKPLFDHYIPSLKIGTFFKEYSNAVLENQKALETGKTTRAELARKTWDFVEDRFGEMNWDNLFWNRTFKTAMQIMFRSTTWKMGNLRASGGAFYGQTKEFYDAIKEGRRPQLSPKMAWFFGMTVVTAIIATIIQQVSTGERPKEARDFVFPKIDKDGTRVSVPSYWRDIISLKRSPTTYITHSLSGFIGKMIETWENKDYYGNQVYNDRDPVWKQVKDVGLNFAPKPFAIQSAMNTQGKEKTTGFFGFTKAPAYVSNTTMQNEIYDLYNRRFGGGVKSPGQTEKSAAYKEYKQLLKAGKTDDAQKLLEDTVNSGVATTKGFDLVKANMSKGVDKMLFDRLPADDKKYLESKMTQQEKDYYTAKKAAGRPNRPSGPVSRPKR